MAWKSLLVLILSIFLSLHLGCTSSKSDDTEDSDVELAEEEGDFEEDDFREDEEFEDDEGDEELADALDEDEGEEGFEEDDLYGEDEEDQEFAGDENQEQDESSLFTANDEDTEGFSDPSEGEGGDNLGIDLGSEDYDTAEQEEAIPQPDLAPQDDFTPVDQVENEPLSVADGGAQQTWIPVKKIKTQPYERAGELINTVYLARPEDTVASISQRIYGEDRSAKLLEINPWLARGVDPGDKLYYNSPNRPDDSSQILTYPEDSGLTPTFYQTKEGDNIRAVAKELMGYDGAWKEVWAVNPELSDEEKSSVAPGHNLKYWPSLDAAGSTGQGQQELAQPSQQPVENSDSDAEAIAQENSAEPLEDIEQAPPLDAEDEIALNPPENFEDLEDPFASESEGSEDLSSIEDFEPPPPPAAEPEQPVQQQRPKVSTAANANNDMIMMMGAGALILLGAAGLLVARRKRAAQKAELDAQAFEDIERTEVG